MKIIKNIEVSNIRYSHYNITDTFTPYNYFYDKNYAQVSQLITHNKFDMVAVIEYKFI